MANPLKTRISGAVFASVISMIPVGGTAQMVDVAPTGSFSFASLFGSAEPQSLPLELSDDSAVAAAPVVVATQQPDVQTTRLRSRLVRNTWSVGVFR